MGAAALALVRYPWQQLPGLLDPLPAHRRRPVARLLRQHRLHVGAEGRGLHPLRVPGGDRRAAGRDHRIRDRARGRRRLRRAPGRPRRRSRRSSASTRRAGPPSATAPSRATCPAGTPPPSPTTGRRAWAPGARSPLRRPAPSSRRSSRGSTRVFPRIRSLTPSALPGRHAPPRPPPYRRRHPGASTPAPWGSRP